jgi:hypothetical protein
MSNRNYFQKPTRNFNRFFLAIGCLVLFFHGQSQTAIVLQHGNTTTIERRLDSAILHAQNGAVIYLPGGLITVPGTTQININKKISIIGAGYRPDSSSVTTATQLAVNLKFVAGSTPCLITGIYFTNADILLEVDSITVTRCNIRSLFLTTNQISGSLIEENVIKNSFQANIVNTTANMLFRKNIVFGSISGNIVGGLILSNNILFGSSISQLRNCLFQNNVFAYNGNVEMFQSNSFYNNLFTTNQVFPANSSTSGNIFNEPLSNIFTSYVVGSAWSVTQNFHLKTGCNGISAGTDGTDIGLYGSSAPFKDGGIPFNPHYHSAVISNASSPSGLLNINITVKAQNH